MSKAVRPGALSAAGQVSDDAEGREREAVQDGEEDEAAVLEPAAERRLGALEDPVGDEIQGDAREDEVEAFHR